MGRGGYHSSRAEFLSDEAILKYNRNGGCFVTTKKAIAFVIFALGSLLTVVLLMYFYGPNRHEQKIIVESNDIEKLLNDTLNEQVPKDEFRLPNTFNPLQYRLWIHPILDEYDDKNFTFSGRVKILVNCLKETNKIVLNWDELNITHSDIRIYSTKGDRSDMLKPPLDLSHNLAERDIGEDDNVTTPFVEDESVSTTVEETTTLTDSTVPVTETTPETTTKLELTNWPVKEISTNEESLKLTITTEKNLQQDEEYIIDIMFNGQILNNLVGLYRTHYVDLSGKTRWLVTTHFQPIYARRVFPCFDEPKFKAPFEISIARRTNMTALSNMPLRGSEPINETAGWVWDHFEETPPMSTYIVAFTVSDFESVSSDMPTTGPTVKIWAPKEDLSQAYYALNITHELVPFLEDYFDIKYPLPKLDMLAIPNFGKSAMENWGLISFRKSSLLFDTTSRSIKTKSFIMAKVAHELAHQWFGNLVTMEWWSDLWLNEGFGTFMAEVAITRLRPRWHAYSSIKIRDTYNTLYFDTLKSTRSIQTQIENNGQIEQIFDTIIYQKGSSILKMLNYTLSENIFVRGIQHYLKKYSYQSSTQDDLWTVFTRKAQNESVIPSSVTVKDLMKSWSTQSGYPYITVTRNYSASEAVLNQTKMTEDTNITADTLWYIPISYMTENDNNVKISWLKDERQTVLSLNGTGNDSWLLLNIDETGRLAWKSPAIKVYRENGYFTMSVSAAFCEAALLPSPPSR